MSFDNFDQPQSKLDFAEFLRSREFACEGILLAWQEAVRQPAIGCPHPDMADGVTATISVTSLIAGVINDSVLTVFIPSPVIRRMPSPGTRVVALGYHDCPDSWRVIGAIVPVDTAGTMMRAFPAVADRVFWLRGVRRSAPLTIDALRRRLKRIGPSPVDRILVKASALELVRIASATHEADGRTRLSCIPLAIIVGHADLRLHSIVADASEGCSSDIAIGDSLAVPVGRAAQTVRLPVCPAPFRVVRGYVPWFDAPLANVGSRITVESGHLVPVRRPLKP